MSSECIFSESKFIQHNLPGVPGYSQRGASGDTGESGSSIYYTPLSLSNDKDRKTCVNKIFNDKELSNNTDYNSETVEYKNNDMVLDINGDLWLVTITYKKEEPDTKQKVKLIRQNNIITYFTGGTSSDKGIVDSFRVYRNFDSSTSHQWDMSKDKIDEKSLKLPYHYYRDRYYPAFYGNWYKMDLKFVNTISASNYVYKYVMVLPDGITVEQISTEYGMEVKASGYVFVDNRMLYGTWSEKKSSDYESIRQRINYDSSVNNGERDASTTNEFHNLIKDTCKAYVEIMDKTCGKVYRIYADSIEDGSTAN